MIDSVLRFLGLMFVSYLIVAVFIYFYQRKLVYFPDKAHARPIDWQLGDMEVLTLNTQDGLQLQAWYHPAKAPNMPTLVYFHGNGGHLGYRTNIIRPYLNAGFGVLLSEYRGYGGNPGKPTEAGLYLDAEAAMAYLKSQQVPSHCLVLYGESLGTGVAVEMATRHTVAGMVLQTPFTSLPNVGQHHYPYLPVRWFLKDRFASIDKITEIKVPVLVLHGDNDRVVPFSHGQTLFNAANEPKQFKHYPRSDHNNLPISAMADAVFAFHAEHRFCEAN